MNKMMELRGDCPFFPRAAAVMLFQSDKVVSRGYVKLDFHRTKNYEPGIKLKLINWATPCSR